MPSDSDPAVDEHRGKVEATIDAMVGTPTPAGIAANTVPNSSAQAYYPNTPYPVSSDTAIPVGLQGAWYTLSPQWRSLWPNPNPTIQLTPAEIAAGKTQLTNTQLPHNYDTPNMSKAVLLLSDGDNI